MGAPHPAWALDSRAWYRNRSRTSRRSARTYVGLRVFDLHDVDHGEKTKAKAKKMRYRPDILTRKYAGAPSPSGLAPERFVLVKANLLGALRNDLQQLRGDL